MTLDDLSGYPCPRSLQLGECREGCHLQQPCQYLPIYRANIAMRAVILGEMTPAVAREIYSATAGLCEGMALYNAAGRLHALADVVAKL